MRGCLFGIRKGLEEKTERTCCCRGFACNNNSTYVQRILVFEEPSTTLPTVVSIRRAIEYKTPRPKEISRKETVIFGLISSVFAIFLILSIVFISWRCAARKNKLLLASMRQYDEKLAEETVEYSILNTDEVLFGELLCKGKFCSTWLAEIRGRNCVIKIYKTEFFSRWKNEKIAYDILGFHPNIAEFIDGVELHGAKPEKAIVLGYYPRGSLRTHLSSHVLSWKSMYDLIFSLANAAAYIHGEIDEYDNLRLKFIVHRNLNSNNVLLKEDGTCVLSDFETSARVTGKHTLPMAQGASTRYMAPEVLCCKVNWNSWESALKQADVYSLGLILWEIVQKCADFYCDNQQSLKALLPYQKELGNNPSVTQIIEHTVKQRKRPDFPPAMGLPDKSDFLLKSTIEECWDTEPEARLTALCVVKRMQEIGKIKNSSVVSGDDDYSEHFIEVFPGGCGRSKEQERCAEQINMQPLPFVDYSYAATVPGTCMDDSSLEESLIKSHPPDYMHPDAC